MNWLRRGLLELWAMALLAVVVGFMGPFGTYVQDEFPTRVWMWFIHLMGAYVLVRPAIWFLMALADSTSLPRNTLVGSGVALISLPLALVWRWGASMFFQGLGVFSGLLPFAFLSAVAILGIFLGARWIDESLHRGGKPIDPSGEPSAEGAASAQRLQYDDASQPDGYRPCRLSARLSNTFVGPILALQSEDHYVRVHGLKTSELLLMRLRDAISEMDACEGQQVHRSWWVAKSGISAVKFEGRSRSIVLLNGETTPVARESVIALEKNGFLKANA